MSKAVKQMQMDVLAKQFDGVKDMLLISYEKIDAMTENTMRLDLRKKNVRLQMVKNSLLRRVFKTSGVALPDGVWAGPTVVAWGGDSIKGLSKEVEKYTKDIKLKDKIKVKTAVAEGLPISFAMALKMPTRLEAIGEIVSAFTSPGSAIAGALTGPASQLASQLQTIAERAPEETVAA